MLDRQLVEDVANRLDTAEGLVEKDWHVVRALRVLSSINSGDVQPIFSGGTSLSIAWGIIKRFSEDIDFKVALPAGVGTAKARTLRRSFREQVLAALGTANFTLVGTPLIGNESKFFAADFSYPSEFETMPGLRPHLRIEMTFQAPVLPPVSRPIQSLIARTQRQEPELAAFPCVDPVETAADKLSALAWRVCVRDRTAENDDPTIIRHLHDLAALERRVIAEPNFKILLRAAAAADTGRGGGQAPADPRQRFAQMFDKLGNDALWAREYADFVDNVSFACADETIAFPMALAATQRLVDATS